MTAAGQPPWLANGQFGGDLDRLAITGVLLAPFNADFRGDARALSGDWHWQGESQLRNLDLRAWQLGGALGIIHGTLRLDGNRSGFRAQGTLEPPGLQAGPLAVDFAGKYAAHVLDVGRLVFLHRDSGAQLSAAGQIGIVTGGPRLDLRGQWHELRWPLAGLDAGAALHSGAGSFTLTGLKPYALSAARRAADTGDTAPAVSRRRPDRARRPGNPGRQGRGFRRPRTRSRQPEVGAAGALVGRRHHAQHEHCHACARASAGGSISVLRPPARALARTAHCRRNSPTWAAMCAASTPAVTPAWPLPAMTGCCSRCSCSSAPRGSRPTAASVRIPTCASGRRRPTWRCCTAMPAAACAPLATCAAMNAIRCCWRASAARACEYAGMRLRLVQRQMLISSRRAAGAPIPACSSTSSAPASEASRHLRIHHHRHCRRASLPPRTARAALRRAVRAARHTSRMACGTPRSNEFSAGDGATMHLVLAAPATPGGRAQRRGAAARGFLPARHAGDVVRGARAPRRAQPGEPARHQRAAARPDGGPEHRYGFRRPRLARCPGGIGWRGAVDRLGHWHAGRRILAPSSEQRPRRVVQSRQRQGAGDARQRRARGQRRPRCGRRPAASPAGSGPATTAGCCAAGRWAANCSCRPTRSASSIPTSRRWIASVAGSMPT